MTKTVKKILALILSILMLESVMPMGMALAADSYTSGYYIYELSDDDAIIIDYTGSETEMVIPAELDGHTVIQVGNNGNTPFYENTSATSIKIPDSVKIVFNGSFYGCKALKYLEIGDGVELIGNSVFQNSPLLETVVFGKNVKNIDRFAFGGCPIQTICYKGSQEDWAKIGINANGNDSIIQGKTTAIFKFNYCEHILDKTAEKEANCEGDGNKEYWSCSKCERLFEDEDATVETTIGKVTVIGGHKWADIYIDGEDGRHYYICETCGAKDEATAQEHTWDEGEVTLEPTCTEPGVRTYKCTVDGCEAKTTATITANGHTEVENHIQQPTCTEPGKTGGKWCTVCKKYTVAPTDIDPLGHTWESIGDHEFATCTTPASGERKCSVCGEVEEDTTPALGHKYETWNVSTPATCKEQGIKVSVCERCTFIGTDFIPATNHEGTEKRIEEINVQAGTCATERTWTEATYCKACGDKVSEVAKTGEKDPENHIEETYTANENIFSGTCKSPAKWYEVTYCKGCDAERSREQITGDLNTNSHVGALKRKIENEKAGSCIVHATWDEVTYCSVCGFEVKRVSVVGEYNTEKHLGIKKTRIENEVMGTCTVVATWDQVVYCSGCEAVIEVIAKTGEKDADNHTGLISEDAVDATCLEVGYTAGTYCEDCEKWVSGHEEIPALNHEDENRDHICDNNCEVYQGEHIDSSTDDDHVCDYGCGEILEECADGDDDDHNCDVCGAEDITEHEFTQANCKAPATCTICGEIRGTVNRENHVGGTYKEIEDEEEATCTSKASWNEVTYCSGCDEVLNSVSKQGAIDPENHAWSEDITTVTDGAEKAHFRVCTRNGCDGTWELGHNFTGAFKEDTPATCIATGAERAYCSYCKGFVYRILPKTAHKDQDKNNKCDVCSVTIQEKPADPTPDVPDEGGDVVVPNCDCNCHKNGIIGFLFDFVLFFQRLLGWNKTCPCGIDHY